MKKPRKYEGKPKTRQMLSRASVGIDDNNPRGLDHEPKDDAERMAVLRHGIQPEGCLHPRHPSQGRIKDYKSDKSSR